MIAQFNVTEDQFRDWMEENDRPTQKITTSEDVTVCTRTKPPGFESMKVESGYRWDDYDTTDEYDDSGKVIVFDATSIRVYVQNLVGETGNTCASLQSIPLQIINGQKWAE